MEDITCSVFLVDCREINLYPFSTLHRSTPNPTSKEPQQKSSVIKIGIRSILSSEQQQKAQAEARSRKKKEKREPSNFLRRSANSPGLSKDEKTKENEEQDREKHAN
mgnify:CR=1 FL=1|jgi:hypothetical protein